MSSFRRHPAPGLLAAGLCGLSLSLPLAAEAYPVVRPVRVVTPPPAPVLPARNWPAPYQDYPQGYLGQAPQGSNGQPVPTSWEEAQALQQRCSIGRLVGGVVGGGIGYAASRQDGRAWAVPLGALLGSQMGCNTGLGRGPLPW